MDRQTDVRQALDDALRELIDDREPLDLIEDIPMIEAAVDGIADERVRQARAAGASWAAIASRLGVTRQAAHKRFGTPSGRRRGLHLELRLERGSGSDDA